jgi:hypothetical protein
MTHQTWGNPACGTLVGNRCHPDRPPARSGAGGVAVVPEVPHRVVVQPSGHRRHVPLLRCHAVGTVPRQRCLVVDARIDPTLF